MQWMARACGRIAPVLPLVSGMACSTPDLASDPDTEGPPEVVEVNVASETADTDPNGNAVEAATYCRPGEEFKVSTFYCPLARDDSNTPIPGDRELEGSVTDAIPVGWHVRFIFSELLDPAVEDLMQRGTETVGTIAETQPAILSCGGVEREYDGWYDPTGNQLSYPPGPGLVVTLPDGEFVATGTSCEVSLADTVVDKDGEAVPEAMRGPYEFAIAPLQVASSSPADDSEGIALTATVQVVFNAPIELTTVTDRVVLTADEVPVAGELRYLAVMGEDDQTTIEFAPTDPLAPATEYTLTVADGITDTAGGLLDQGEEAFTATFTTGEE